METGLTLSGWLFLIAAWSSIIATTLYCFWRVLRSQGRKKSI